MSQTKKQPIASTGYVLAHVSFRCPFCDVVIDKSFLEPGFQAVAVRCVNCPDRPTFMIACDATWTIQHHVEQLQRPL